ncbi:hypothetical protein MRX96_038905 [Rhipicephalus microplus]
MDRAFIMKWRKQRLKLSWPLTRGQAKEFGTFPGFVALSVAVAALQHPVVGTWLAAPVRLDSESKVSNKRSHNDFGELIDAPGSVYTVAVKCEERTSWLF